MPQLQDTTSAKTYADLAKKSSVLKSLTFSGESPQTAKFRDNDFISY